MDLIWDTLAFNFLTYNLNSLTLYVVYKHGSDQELYATWLLKITKWVYQSQMPHEYFLLD